MSWRSRKVGINLNSAYAAVREHGILLVYPINNRPLPLSLWSYFFPKTKMRWVWDETGDSNVVRMWDLRERMSRSDKVVYTKWYQGRATFISREVFTGLLSILNHSNPSSPELNPDSRLLFELLQDNSPQTTKALKKRAKTELAWQNRQYDRAMKELWHKLLIVGCGEVDDGAFPSLNVGATQLMFEDLWEKAHVDDPNQWNALIDKFLPSGSLWRKNLERIYELPKEEKQKPQKKVLYYKDLVRSQRK